MKIVSVTLKDICDEIGIAIPSDIVSLKNSKISSVNCLIDDVVPGGLFFITDEYAETDSDKEEAAKQALNKGVLAIFCQSPIKTKHIHTDDITKAFSKAVYCFKKNFDAKTVCITGSIGKTSATQMVSHLLSDNYETYSSSESSNNLRCTGLFALRVKSKHKYYVQETMEAPPAGYASHISEAIHPDAAIITRVSDSHIDYMKTKENIAASCLGVEDFMTDSGILFLNADDPYQMALTPKHDFKTFGVTSERADYRAENIDYDENGHLTMSICYENKKVKISIPCIGKYNAYNVASAFAVGKWAGITDENIALSLSTFQTVGIRQNLIHEKGQTLFLDCFNASSDSTKSAIDTLCDLKPKGDGQRIMVLGFLSEVSSVTRQIHSELGHHLAASKVDKIICFGEDTKTAAEICKSAGKETYQTNDRNELNDFIRTKTKENDILLFKGSRASLLETTVESVYGTYQLIDEKESNVDRHYLSKDGLGMRFIDDHVVVYWNEEKKENIKIPDSAENAPVTGILDGAFAYDEMLSEITLPSKLAYIKGSAFAGTKITKIKIPDSVMRVEAYAFYRCKKLSKVTIGSSVYHIGDHCFDGCPIKEITLPDTLTYIGGSAFEKDVVINCTENSLAHLYAKENGLKFELVKGKKLDKTPTADIPPMTKPKPILPPSAKQIIISKLKKTARKIGLK